MTNEAKVSALVRLRVLVACEFSGTVRDAFRALGHDAMDVVTPAADRVWNPVLIELARISPPEYAQQIRDRNLSLLKRLRLLEPYLGMQLHEVPGPVLDEVENITHIGCPHCANSSCSSCQWLTTHMSGGCTGAEFPLSPTETCMFVDVHDSENVALDYGAGVEGLYCYDIVDAEQYRRLRLFLEAHVWWANLKCWGRDLNSSCNPVYIRKLNTKAARI